MKQGSMFKCYQSKLKVEGIEFFLLEFISYSLHHGVHQLLTASANNPKPHPAKNQKHRLCCLGGAPERVGEAREADRDF